MTSRRKRVLVRFGRVAAAGALGAVIVAIPGLLDAVPKEYLFIAQPIVVAGIAALDKLRRELKAEEA